MDNNDFINLYIEKILGKMTDTERKYILLETQFEFNKKAWEENSKELEQLTKELEDSKNSINSLTETLVETKNEVGNLRTSINNKNDEIDNLRKEHASIINQKNNDLHVLTLQIEELKKINVEKEQEKSKLLLELKQATEVSEIPNIPPAPVINKKSVINKKTITK